MKGTVLVVGAGISGMRASAELVQQGFRVALLEQNPTIGGCMARLDKMYPSNECATCTQLPKMLELTSDPNVDILAFANLKEVEETEAGFRVRIEKKVRYVDPLKCNACTECFAACPVGGVPMEFNLGRGVSKAIRFWSPFPPRKALVDPQACTYILEGKCGDGTIPLCAKACEPEAIDFSQKPAEVQLEVGAIILAVGADEERGELVEKLGHGRLPNVLTALEYERLLSGLGPTGGVVKRDDGTVPRRLAWLVSEDFNGGLGSVSPVGFMTAATEALGTLERDASAEVTVISTGPKLEGKGYKAFYEDALRRGVRFADASTVEVSEGSDGGVAVAYQGGQSDTLDVDMLVLTSPMRPPEGLTSLAQTLGIDIGPDGFPVSREGHPQHTTRDGVFLCGTAGGPKGISEAVVEACAASAGAAARLADVRGSEMAQPPQRQLHPVAEGDEPRIAVVICRCGANIAGALDVEELAEYVRALPHVARVEVTPFGCDGVKIGELLTTGEYNRLVIGGCSPRTHEPLFQMQTEAGGLNRYLMEIVNLRNQCTWVHAGDPEGLARKARALMRMGVARVALQAPLDPFIVPVEQSCLVVGGTIAGVACAAKLGEMGFTTHLVMAERELGEGLGEGSLKFLEPVLRVIERNRRVHIHPASRIKDMEGFVGNYRAEISSPTGGEGITVGTVVVATADKMGTSDNEDILEKALYLSRDDEAFFVGALGILNPFDFNTDGVYMCGDAREPSDAARSLVSGEAAASRAATILSQSEMQKSPVVSFIVDEKCDGCAYCIEPCPAHAITLLEYMSTNEIRKTVEVNEALCRGCGSCMATCPKEGAFIHHFKPEQITAMVKALLEVA